MEIEIDVTSKHLITEVIDSGYAYGNLCGIKIVIMCSNGFINATKLANDLDVSSYSTDDEAIEIKDVSEDADGRYIHPDRVSEVVMKCCGFSTMVSRLMIEHSANELMEIEFTENCQEACEGLNKISEELRKASEIVEEK